MRRIKVTMKFQNGNIDDDYYKTYKAAREDLKKRNARLVSFEEIELDRYGFPIKN
jgi:hypothetical protein